MTSAISAVGVSAGYGPITIARDINIALEPGEVTVLLGANGAGKTTTLLTLAGAIPAQKGKILWGDTEIKEVLYKRRRRGLAFVPDERGAITALTLRDNLRLSPGSESRALELFPELEAHLGRKVGLLSGGQQKMVALALALSSSPQVLLADELSLGLAPLMVTRLLNAVRQAADEGMAVLLVEQHARQALEIADRAALMVHGHITLNGRVADLSSELDEVIKEGYLGTSPSPNSPQLP